MLEINLEGIDEDVLGQSISYSQLSNRDFFTYSFYFGGNNTIKGLSLPTSGNTFVNVRDVGQGSWNEVYIDERSHLIFDIGTHYSTKIEKVIQMFGDRNEFYQRNRPGLIISHWDVDHYHFIKAMSDHTIKSLKFILCRAFAPTLTARVILVRLRGNTNLITVHPQDRNGEKGETPLFSLYNNDRFTIFNSGETRSRNKEGISLLIRNSNNSILLPGDQHYNQFNCFVNLQYLNYRHTHHLVVPHHGGNAGPYKYKLTSKVKKGEAVISVGKNLYGHPFERVIHSLRQESFNVSRTDIRKSDITIHL
jgi:beta-lactamase superfamily II metal-dependent hydrolase